MAFADPQSVTINAVAASLPRVSSGVNAGVFQSSDGTEKLSTGHTYGKRTRHIARLDLQKYAADPLVSAQNVLRSMSAYIVIDVPQQGYTVADQQLNVAGLTKWLTDSSGANVLKLLGGEI